MALPIQRVCCAKLNEKLSRDHEQQQQQSKRVQEQLAIARAVAAAAAAAATAACWAMVACFAGSFGEREAAAAGGLVIMLDGQTD